MDEVRGELGEAVERLEGAARRCADAAGELRGSAGEACG